MFPSSRMHVVDKKPYTPQRKEQAGENAKDSPGRNQSPKNPSGTQSQLIMYYCFRRLSVFVGVNIVYCIIASGLKSSDCQDSLRRRFWPSEDWQLRLPSDIRVTQCQLASERSSDLMKQMCLPFLTGHEARKSAYLPSPYLITISEVQLDAGKVVAFTDLTVAPSSGGGPTQK